MNLNSVNKLAQQAKKAAEQGAKNVDRYWNGRSDEEEAERRRYQEQRRLDDMQYKRACANCEGSEEPTMITSNDCPEQLAEIFGRELRGYLCKICRGVAMPRIKGDLSPSKQRQAAVSSMGDWTCVQCGTHNRPVARVCDRCPARRPETTLGNEYTITLASTAEELGLDCVIQNGSVRVSSVTPGSAAHRCGIPEGIITMVEGEEVHTASHLKKVIDKAKIHQERPSVRCRIIPTDAKGKSVLPPKLDAAGAPVVPAQSQQQTALQGLFGHRQAPAVPPPAAPTTSQPAAPPAAAPAPAPAPAPVAPAAAAPAPTPTPAPAPAPQQPSLFDPVPAAAAGSSLFPTPAPVPAPAQQTQQPSLFDPPAAPAPAPAPAAPAAVDPFAAPPAAAPQQTQQPSFFDAPAAAPAQQPPQKSNAAVLDDIFGAPQQQQQPQMQQQHGMAPQMQQQGFGFGSAPQQQMPQMQQQQFVPQPLQQQQQMQFQPQMQMAPQQAAQPFGMAQQNFAAQQPGQQQHFPQQQMQPQQQQAVFPSTAQQQQLPTKSVDPFAGLF